MSDEVVFGIVAEAGLGCMDDGAVPCEEALLTSLFERILAWAEVHYDVADKPLTLGRLFDLLQVSGGHRITADASSAIPVIC